jgi:anti-sigma regulatory factor (Ser/Thr protein kinase)
MDNLLDIRLSSESGAARHAREALAELAGELDPSVRDSVSLLVSELVSSSVRRMGPRSEREIRLRLLAEPKCVRVEVVDSGRALPAIAPRLLASGWSILHDPGLAGDPGGWGLAIVNAVADRWGIIADRGTEVWFELDLPGR